MQTAVECDICLGTFVHIHTGYVVQDALVAYYVGCSYVRAIVYAKEHLFDGGGHGVDVYLLAGELPEVSP
jgi:hypothetical protein